MLEDLADFTKPGTSKFNPRLMEANPFLGFVIPEMQLPKENKKQA